ncbi:helix-turn-helix domain-containing protein [Paenibacillus sp. Z6-24]
MSYTIERSKLELLHSQGAGIRAIGQVLGRSAGTVSREFKRNGSSGRYDAQEAQQAYAYQREASKPNGKWNPKLASEIESDLKRTHSPNKSQAAVKPRNFLR